MALGNDELPTRSMTALRHFSSFGEQVRQRLDLTEERVETRIKQIFERAICGCYTRAMTAYIQAKRTDASTAELIAGTIYRDEANYRRNPFGAEVFMLMAVGYDVEPSEAEDVFRLATRWKGSDDEIFSPAVVVREALVCTVQSISQEWPAVHTRTSPAPDIVFDELQFEFMLETLRCPQEARKNPGVILTSLQQRQVAGSGNANASQLRNQACYWQPAFHLLCRGLCPSQYDLEC